MPIPPTSSSLHHQAFFGLYLVMPMLLTPTTRHCSGDRQERSPTCSTPYSTADTRIVHNSLQCWYTLTLCLRRKPIVLDGHSVDASGATAQILVQIFDPCECLEALQRFFTDQPWSCLGTLQVARNHDRVSLAEPIRRPTSRHSILSSLYVDGLLCYICPGSTA